MTLNLLSAPQGPTASWLRRNKQFRRVSPDMTQKRILRYAMSSMLIFFLLCAGAPFHSLMGADPLETNDLSGAIRAVRNLVQSAGYHDAFSSNFPQAVEALKVAAGMTQRLSSEMCIHLSQSLGPHLLSSSNHSHFFPPVCQLMQNTADPVKSLVSTPPWHPPLPPRAMSESSITCA